MAKSETIKVSIFVLMLVIAVVLGWILLGSAQALPFSSSSQGQGKPKTGGAEVKTVYQTQTQKRTVETPLISRTQLDPVLLAKTRQLELAKLDAEIAKQQLTKMKALHTEKNLDKPIHDFVSPAETLIQPAPTVLPKAIDLVDLKFASIDHGKVTAWVGLNGQTYPVHQGMELQGLRVTRLDKQELCLRQGSDRRCFNTQIN
ncbi:hypothetical protein [Dongshaea marina]|uniref:hypothetical protein n=1 Tax=Dongshaea marina TaxID=2047966 RepID=UPI000D3EC750|nr:hypothetical protein [Dongshaea marina]